MQTIRMTSKANFREGLDVIRLAIREAYERRKKERLAHEEEKARRKEQEEERASGVKGNEMGEAQHTGGAEVNGGAGTKEEEVGVVMAKVERVELGPVVV